MKRYFIPLVLALFASASLSAQDKDKEDWTGWKLGGGVGLDFSQLLQINPKVGAGEDRITLGGSTNFFARYKNGRFYSDNNAALNLGLQRLGEVGNPFQKTVDELRISSTTGVKFADEKPFSYAIDLTAVSQLTPTYSGNLLVDTTRGKIQHPQAQFFAPVTATITPGIAYKPDDHLSILLSPASIKLIHVGDDSIAILGDAASGSSLHGNPWEIDEQGIITYRNTFFQFGASLRATYQNKFWKNKEGKERLGFSTSLGLYSNYLKNPQNIDVEWITTTDFYIFKGLSITLNTNLFYDHDILVQVNRDNDASTGKNGYESTGRRVSFMQSLLIKYNYLF